MRWLPSTIDHSLMKDPAGAEERNLGLQPKDVRFKVSNDPTQTPKWPSVPSKAFFFFFALANSPATNGTLEKHVNPQWLQKALI